MPPPSPRSRRLTIALVVAAVLASGLPLAKAAMPDERAPDPDPTPSTSATPAQRAAEAPGVGGLASGLAEGAARAAAVQLAPPPPPPAPPEQGVTGAVTAQPAAPAAPEPDRGDEGDDEPLYEVALSPPQQNPPPPTPTPTTEGTDQHSLDDPGPPPPALSPTPVAVPSPTPRPPEAGPDLVAGQFQDAQGIQPGQQTVDVMLDVNIYDRGLAQTHAGRTVIVRVPAGQSAQPVQQLVVDGTTYNLVGQPSPSQPPGQPPSVQLQYDKEIGTTEAILVAFNDWWEDSAAPALASFWADPIGTTCGTLGLCAPPTTVAPIHGNPGAPAATSGGGPKPVTDVDWPEP